jgi:hypothetical protein
MIGVVVRRSVGEGGAEAPDEQAPGALKLSRLVDQRKSLLMDILSFSKQVAT